MGRTLKRLGVAGLIVMAVGAVMIPLQGSGWLLVVAGLLVLAGVLLVATIGRHAKKPT